MAASIAPCEKPMIPSNEPSFHAVSMAAIDTSSPIHHARPPLMAWRASIACHSAAELVASRRALNVSKKADPSSPLPCKHKMRCGVPTIAVRLTSETIIRVGDELFLVTRVHTNTPPTVEAIDVTVICPTAPTYMPHHTATLRGKLRGRLRTYGKSKTNVAAYLLEVTWQVTFSK
eukprot:scaffold4223_cov146-Isochrysis_galbana.AAC.1